MKDTTVLKDGPVRVQYGRSQRVNQYPQSRVKGIIIRATSCAGLRPGVAESRWRIIYPWRQCRTREKAA